MSQLLIFFSLPIPVISISLYLGLSFFKDSAFVWVTSFLVGIFLTLFLLKNSFRISFQQTKQLYSSFTIIIGLIIILAFIAVKAYVISPFIITKTVNNFTHIQITDVGDYYKHTFVTNSLATSGVPPQHPYFPKAKLSYYYGYYLIPAAVTKMLNIDPIYSLFLFVLFTEFISLTILWIVFASEIKNYLGRLSALFLLLFAGGVDILPGIIKEFGIFNNLISPNIFPRDRGLALINNFVAFLYVPQHFFAAALTVAIIYLLIKKEISVVKLTATAVFVCLSSIFVSTTLFWWLFLTFIFYPFHRKKLVITAILTVILLVPYLYHFSGRGNILYFYNFLPFKFLDGDSKFIYLLDLIFTFLIQYGPILFILFLTLIFTRKLLNKRYLPFILGLSFPLVVSWFIRSPVFNDLSMRSSMPIQFVIPLFFVKTIEAISRKKIKLLIFSVSFVTIGLGILAFYAEYGRHWKSRIFLAPRDSELILKVRTFPQNIQFSAVDKDRWVELIPSLGYRQILSPYLFDSYVYLAGPYTAERSKYERLALDLFVKANSSDNLIKLIEDENIRLFKAYDFFDMYHADKLIINNFIWVKKGINPWAYIFKSLGIKGEAITPYYTLINYKDLLEKTKNLNLYIDKDKLVKIEKQSGGFKLSAGLWYIAYCTDSQKQQALLEFEDYYQLFNEELGGVDKSKCVGKMFYLKEKGNILVTNTTTVKNITIFPVEIRSLIH